MANSKVFISYRRAGGADVARLIRESLEKRGFKVFLDVEDMRLSGRFPNELRKNIDDAANVVVVLSPGSLDRCKGPDPDPNDWLRTEVAYAFEQDKNVVPVITRGFQWPTDPLPPDIAPLRECNGIEPSHDYFEASIDRLVGLLSGRPLWRKRLSRYALAVSVLLCLAVFFTLMQKNWQKQPEPGSSWTHDQYVGVRIPGKTMGTLLADEPYDLKLELENCTSMAMYIDKVVVEKFNPAAAKIFGLRNSRVHIAEYHGPIYFNPHEKKTVTIPGNEILPKSVRVKISHNLSKEPSVFEVDLGGVQLPMPAPRILSASMIYRGVDALEALGKARQKALEYCANPQVIAVFPGDSETLLDPATRLKVVVVKNWVTTFFDFDKQKFYEAIVRKDKIEGGMYAPKKADKLNDLHPSPYPLIGNQRALELVNRHHLICADWKGPRLNIVRVGKKWTPAWFLPYRGPDSLPLIVDAITGDRLGLGGGHGSFKRLKKLALIQNSLTHKGN